MNSITYDNNGNIMGLQRRGLREYSAGSPVFGQIDDLTYAYKGTNQLNRVDDSRSDGVSVAGNDFKDRGSEADDEYTYDNNGNLITDDNKQITQISYNHLNLPVQITYNANHKIVYLYDAIGNKLKKTVYNGQDTIITDYVANMIYVDGNLEMVMTEEGRMVPLETGGYRAEYFLKDHLGNNRVSFTDTDDDGDADIIQEDHFYPYGMTMGDLSYVSGTKNNFMYQGKEQQDELNLYWYDFGARMFDEQLGRWHVTDPMNQYASPYIGMGNRPSSMIDPDGMWTHRAYRSDLTGFDTYRLSRYRAYHNYNRDNNVLGKSMAELHFEEITGRINLEMQQAGGNSIENIIWGISNYSGMDASISIINKNIIQSVTEILKKLQDEQKVHKGNLIPSTGILFPMMRETDAYVFMRLASVNLGVEVGGWLTEQGVLIEPTKGKTYDGMYKENDRSTSYGYIPLKIVDNKFVASFKGELIEISGRIHTHLSEAPPSYEADYLTSAKIRVPNFIIGDSDVFVALGFGNMVNKDFILRQHGYFQITSQIDLINNNVSLIDISKQLQFLFYQFHK